VRAAWWVVFRKEARETLRDRRTLLMMVVVPVLLYPVLLVASEQLLLFGQRRLEAEASPVAVVGPAPQGLVPFLETREALEIVVLTEDPEDAIRSEDVAAVAVVRPPSVADGTQRVTLLYDATSDRSQRARTELDRALRDWRDTLLARRLAERGLPPTFAAPLAFSDSSIARPDEVGGYTLGRILPLLLVVVTLLGAFYPAIDLAAGEKERGTLEALLTAPVPPGAIVAGKFVAVALVGIVAAALNLASMLLTFQTGVLQVSQAIGLEVALPWWSIGVIFLALVPLAVLFGAVFLGLAVRASSFKEAQSTLTPVTVLVLVPAMLPVFPGIEPSPALVVLPVAGVSFLVRDLMAGDATWVLAALVLASTSFYASLALAFAARAFGSERVLFGAGEPAEVSPHGWLERWRTPSRGGTVPEPAAALGFVALLAVLFFYGGIRLQVRFGEVGLVASEWLLLFVPALLFVALGRYDPRETLSLRAPSGSAVLAALLLVAGALPVVWLIGWLQSFVLPIPWDLLEGLEELVTADSPARFAWLLVAVALTPALCEEVVFRGVLLGATRRLDPWRTIVLNGLVFGAFHLSFETVIRFLPTALLGMLIAWAVWRSGSIWVGALMHFTNNAVVIVLASAPFVGEALSDPEAPPPVWLVPLGAVVLALGVRMLDRRAAA
jgi:sodium transport system permease protein